VGGVESKPTYFPIIFSGRKELGIVTTMRSGQQYDLDNNGIVTTILGKTQNISCHWYIRERKEDTTNIHIYYIYIWDGR
jgi:hypothetical protein